MYKLKSNRGAAKRFKRTASGLLKRRRANRNHMLIKKKTKQKRQLRASVYTNRSDVKAINKLLAN